MVDAEKMPKAACEWPAMGGRYQLTGKQIQRRRRGQSIYERDRQVEPYKVNKGERV